MFQCPRSSSPQCVTDRARSKRTYSEKQNVPYAKVVGCALRKVLTEPIRTTRVRKRNLRDHHTLHQTGSQEASELDMSSRPP